MQRCDTCRFWSDKIAQAIGGGPVEAYCLSGDGEKAGKYTPGFGWCDKWQDAPLGAVDSGSESDPQYGNPYLGNPDPEPSELQQGLIPIPDNYNEQ